MKLGSANELCVATAIRTRSEWLYGYAKELLAKKNDYAFKLAIAEILIRILHLTLARVQV